MDQTQTRQASLKAPVRPTLRWWRNTALVYGAALLVWFSLEDNQTLPVVLFGVGMALLWGWRQALHQTTNKGLKPLVQNQPALLPTPNSQLLALVLGLLIGAGAAVATTGLMFFKTAWHAHVYPDYPTEMMLAMLSRAPAWGLAGVLLAAAWLMFKSVIRSGD